MSVARGSQVDPDGYIHQRVKGMGKAVLEDTDVDLWFKDRLERYYQRLEIKSESDVSWHEA